MTFLIFIVAGLATFRLSLLISKEDGPAWIFAKLRKAPPPKSSARQGLQCPWCVAVWMSALVTTYLWWLGYVPGREWPLYWLALSSFSIIVNQQWTKG